MGGENKTPEMKMIPTAEKPSLPSHIFGVPVLASINNADKNPINTADPNAPQTAVNENTYLITERRNACLKDMRRLSSSIK